MLAKYYRLPPVVSGVEAFARFDVVNVLEYFEDWPVWSIRQREGPLEPAWIDAWDANDKLAGYVTDDDARFSRAHVQRLEALASDTALDQPVRAFLMWGNSD